MPGPILGAGDRPVNKNGCCPCPLGPSTVLGETDRSSSYIRCQEVTNDVKRMIKQHEENKSDEVGRVAILHGVVRKDRSDKVPFDQRPNGGREGVWWTHRVSVPEKEQQVQRARAAGCLEHSPNCRWSVLLEQSEVGESGGGGRQFM